MISIYKNFYQNIADAYNYPLLQIQLLLKQLKILDNKKQIEDKEQVFKLFKKLTNELGFSIIEKSQQFFENKNAISDSLIEVQEFVSSFENIVLQNQLKERFYPQKGDSKYIKTLKKSKLLFQQLIWLIPKTGNFFRRLLKKEQKEITFKKHKIRKQKLAQLVFINYFLKEIDQLYEKTLSNRQIILIELKNIIQEISEKFLTEYSLTTNEINAKLVNIEKEINTKKAEAKHTIEITEQSLNSNFEELQKKYGTFEFPTRKTKSNVLKSQKKRVLNKFSKIYYTYKLSHRALIEHQILLLDIQNIFVDTNLVFNNAIKTIEQNFINQIENKYIPISNELEKWLNENNGKEKYNTKLLNDEIVEKLIPNFSNELLKVDLSSIIDNIEIDTKNLIHDINTTIEIPKKGDFEKPLTKNQIKKINSKVILQENYDLFIIAKLKEERRELIQKLQIFLKKANELIQILEFSIDFLEKEIEKENTKKEFFEGIERASIRSKDIYNDIILTKENIINELNSIKSNYIITLFKSMQPDTLVRTIKKQERENRIKEINSKAKNYITVNFKIIEKVIKQLKTIHKKTKIKYQSLKILFGISTPAETISNEISNFLSDTNATIKSLPFMYQKLFKSEPLNTTKLYIPRPQIDSEIDLAFAAWTKNNYAPTCLNGESGNGITTCINFFQKRVDNKYPVYRFNINTQITAEDDFIKLLKDIFNDISFNNLQTLEKKLEKTVNKRIIIIENIHNLFGRYNNGFNNINLLLDIISFSNSKVFWVCSANLYSWKYLNNAINLSDYFGYNIQIDSLKKEEIIEIIKNRHLPSGYKMNFLPRENFIASRKFKKMNIEAQKDFLQKDFFNLLYKNTNGNIKITLLFWQTSVVEMGKDTFSFQLKEIDHSFLESLGVEKLTTLHNILIHEGLSIEEFSKVFNISKTQSIRKVMILENDSILIKQNNEYQINPLLYRQVVDHLKATNFIY